MKDKLLNVKKCLWVVITVATFLSTSAQSRPVEIGIGVPESLDACALGEVHGLNPKGDGFLAVRNSPSVKAKMLYKVKNGQRVWMCDESKNGKWIGVIYTKKGIDCHLERRGPYKGRCYQGWVSARYIRVIAG